MNRTIIHRSGRTRARLARIAILLTGLGVAAGATAAERKAAPADPRPIEYPYWQTLAPGDYLGYNQRASLAQRGKLVYDKYCIGCHGVKGDGKGVAAARLITQPRDFTKGVYKFRSTDSSSLPLESDLYRTISRGLGWRASMPGFPLMPERDKLAVIEYLKTFFPRWEKDKGERVLVAVPRAPADIHAPARVQRGRVVYTAMQCGSCHGDDGRGGNQVFTDLWGFPQRAFDFTLGQLKGGDDPEDIYRTFNAGLVSVMPSFGGGVLANVSRESFDLQKGRLGPGEYQALEPILGQFPATNAEILTGMAEPAKAELSDRNSWDLVAYILSLSRPTSTAQAVLGVAP